MLSSVNTQRVYLACGGTDMRKSIDGLAALVVTGFKLDLFSDCWFVFCNKGQDKLKILHWDHNGFWLYYRRLERGHFRWPSAKGGTPLLVTRRELQWLLDGLTLEQKQAHTAVLEREVA
jgi:transposase